MKKRIFGLLAALSVSVAVPAIANDSVMAGQSDAKQWVMQLGNYAGTRYSELDQINKDNVGDLQVAWTFSTGGWVYSGPAVASVPGTKPSVYIGSFDGNVYALDARDGGLRWTFDMGGKVIGSLSVIGRLVYASTFEGTTTYGIGTRKGNKRFTYFTGAYMPAISDGRRLYLVGYSSIHALEPKRSVRRPAPGRKPS